MQRSLLSFIHKKLNYEGLKILVIASYYLKREIPLPNSVIVYRNIGFSNCKNLRSFCFKNFIVSIILSWLLGFWMKLIQNKKDKEAFG